MAAAESRSEVTWFNYDVTEITNIILLLNIYITHDLISNSAKFLHWEILNQNVPYTRQQYFLKVLYLMIKYIMLKHDIVFRLCFHHDFRWWIIKCITWLTFNIVNQYFRPGNTNKLCHSVDTYDWKFLRIEMIR